MKYIRTKDNIYAVSINFEPLNGMKIYSVGNGITIKHNQVIQKANTIEELCDEFVTKVEHPNPHGTKPHGHYMNEMSFKDIVKYYLSSIEEKGKTYDVYGAIWTEDGLKYVAKLNDKGELELL